MAGRSFQITRLEDSPRSLLHRVLNAPEVIDGAIQGSQVRIVLAGAGRRSRTWRRLGAGAEAAFEPVPPRLEDAFIDLLGGGPGGDSALADGPGHGAGSDPGPEADHPGPGPVQALRRLPATDDVSFKVDRGEIFGLLGPNGAGKSTTFKMLCGLLKPTCGQAQVMGLNLRTPAARPARSWATWPRSSPSTAQLSVRQNLEFFAGIYGLDGARPAADRADGRDLHLGLPGRPAGRAAAGLQAAAGPGLRR